MNIDVRKADQQIRGAMVLPNGTGKTSRVLVFARGAKAEEAKAAGADFVGEDDLVAKINGGWLDFDVVIATPDMMAVVGRLGRVLGPRNLMPNPKTGTVTMDVAKAFSRRRTNGSTQGYHGIDRLAIPMDGSCRPDARHAGVVVRTDDGSGGFQPTGRTEARTKPGTHQSPMRISSQATGYPNGHHVPAGTQGEKRRLYPLLCH